MFTLAVLRYRFSNNDILSTGSYPLSIDILIIAIIAVISPKEQGSVGTVYCRLNKCKGPGCDGISPVFLHSCAKSLSLSIAFLFRQSLKECVLWKRPKLWKRPLIFPIYKKGSKSSIQNYGPISIIHLVPGYTPKFVAKNRGGEPNCTWFATSGDEG